MTGILKTLRASMGLMVLGGAGVYLWGWMSPAANSSRAITSQTAALPSRVQTVAVMPYNPDQIRDTAAFWEKRTRDDPQGALGWNHLASSYLQLARETGDADFAQRAERAARRSLKILPGGHNAGAHLSLSRSLLSQHRFSEALQSATKAARFDADAERLRVDILLELGQYDAAERVLNRIPHTPEDANWNALQARLLELNGQPIEALKLWQTACNVIDQQSGVSSETRAWYHFRYGLALMNAGQAAPAREQFATGLTIFPRDYRILSAQARLSANEGDWKTALRWAKQAAAIVPSPEIVALQGDAYAALGQERAAKDQFRILEAMDTLSRAQGAIYDRQRALLNASRNRNLPEALRLARGELKLRRDIYTYDTLAWVSYKNGLIPEARVAIESALTRGTRDAQLFFHAGMIYHAAGEPAQAKRYLQEALEINPRFSPTEPQQARAVLAKLG